MADLTTSRAHGVDMVAPPRTRLPSVPAIAAIGLTAALVAGAALRLSYANWDDGGHLHPDERYISTVANDVRWPSSPAEYLDVENSPLSPYNTETGRAYVYGTFPLFGVKLVASTLGMDSYDQLYLVGRYVGALLDVATIGLVFLIALLVLGDRRQPQIVAGGAALAALLYAFTVTSIQHAHFFTTDVWLVFFTVLTFLLAARAIGPSESTAAGAVNWRFVVCGLTLGLTVACKAPGVLTTVPVLVALGVDSALVGRRSGSTRGLVRFLVGLLLTTVAAYLAYRTVSPYAFASSNWLDPSLHPQFRAVLEEETRRVNGGSLFPPTYQWLLSTPVWDPLRNLVVWQLGPPLGLVALLGLALLLVRVVRYARETVSRSAGAVRSEQGHPGVLGPSVSLMLLVFVLAVFFWIAPRFAHMGRYLVPIAPFMAIAAGYSIVVLFGRHRRLFAAVGGALLLATALYALAFQHVLVEKHTRIAASEWIADRVPPGSTIASEHWDDSLPVGGLAHDYQLRELPVFEPDDGMKVRRLFEGLAESEYYVLSSPRAWRTIGRLPTRFPLMTRFYRDLFAGRLGFVRVASFTSEPELFGVRLHDLSAEEAFWVYDHPPVLIFRRPGELDWERFHAALCPARDIAACA